MKIPGLKSARKARRWLRSRFNDGILILGYHRIADCKDDPFALCVQPKHFDQHLAVLRQYTKPLSFQNLVDDIGKEEVRSGAVVITFDDGYQDNLTNALPLLSNHQIPAMFFVTTGFLGRQFWWDELAMLVLSVNEPQPVLQLHIGGKPRTWQIDPDSFSSETGDRRRLLRDLYRTLSRLDHHTRQDALDQIYRWVSRGTAIQREVFPRAMNHNELQELADDRLVTIGAHSVNHPWFPELPHQMQQYEINQSKYDLEQLLNQPVTTFSYPNGKGDDVTRTLLRKAGFKSACTSVEDMAYVGSDLLCLPRFWMPDWNGADFARWLHRWL